MTEKNKIRVSVCMITYNHETYISDAIDSVLMQKTNFPIELIIGEDCSTDNTRNICLEYQQKYPDIIKLILPEENLGVMPNFIETLNEGSGKYIAICEGDDYWTDPFKLQKQVDFMELNEVLSFCFHNARIHNIKTDEYEDFNQNLKSKKFNTNDLLMKGWFIPTASILLRKDKLPKPFPEWFYKIYNGDYGLELLLSLEGDFYYINDRMSVYRKNALNSLSIVSFDKSKFLKRKLFLIQKFTNYCTNKNKIINNFIIFKLRLSLLKVYFFNTLSFKLNLTNTIKK